MDSFNTFDYIEYCEKVKAGLSESFCTQLLTSKQRSEVYDFIRYNYPELDVTSVIINGCPEKKMIITLRTVKGACDVIKVPRAMDTYTIMTSDAIKLFSDYSKVPFPVFHPKYFNYYLSIFDKYFRCVEKQKLLEEQLKTKRVGEIKAEIGHLQKTIVLSGGTLVVS